MPEVDITIGGRTFEVACQEGEQHFLQSAAKMLDDEARVLTSQIGRIPEARMLLMAGLMLADKTAGLDDKMRELEAKVAEQAEEIESLKNTPLPLPEKVEVPVVPNSVTDALGELAARAEALASTVEEKATS
ncbi:cell division protein ZapA [Cognatishimia activa]|uniref:Cell division protein ZapA n=1 Tax=Cognatishimia activa TaxID=1715691 RepID=A0A0P1ITX0_9RHOB|nr:cell division protein ZapA [Cognatishimia activa]CUJ36076.1 Cell division protein ZapA [Cognatishimia activa]CUK27013.1 Cell division protein ZapA [Cognatishimia activa]